MAAQRARALHPRWSLAAVAAASVAVLALSACGGPADRTDAGATGRVCPALQGWAAAGRVRVMRSRSTSR